MKSKIKTCIMIIVVLAVACVMTWFAYKIIVESNSPSETVSNVTSGQNEVNKANEKSTNVEKKDQDDVENTLEENTIESNNNNNNNEEALNIIQKNTNNGMSNEEKAISIVKKNWGSEEGVYFTTMGIDPSGRFIVTVNDSSTTAIYASYAVNIETEECEVQ